MSECGIRDERVKMIELIATGQGASERWRRELLAGEVVRLGRAPRHGWSVPWDVTISREHCELKLDGEQL